MTGVDRCDVTLRLAGRWDPVTNELLIASFPSYMRIEATAVLDNEVGVSLDLCVM